MELEYYYSEEGVYRNSKGEIVYGKDPDRKIELVAPGGYLEMNKAKALGIHVEAPTEPEQKAVTLAPANKAVEMPKGKK